MHSYECLLVFAVILNTANGDNLFTLFCTFVLIIEYWWDELCCACVITYSWATGSVSWWQS